MGKGVKAIKWLIDLLCSLAILYIILCIGNFVAHIIPIGVPGSIWGLLILFLCLVLRIIKLNWVLSSATLLIRYMALLFIPITVGIMKYFHLLSEHATLLLVPNIVSTCVTLVTIGYLSDYVFSRSSFKHLRKKALKKRIKTS